MSVGLLLSQRAHDRDAEERRRRQGRAEDHMLRFVTGVGAEHGRLPQLRGTTAEALRCLLLSRYGVIVAISTTRYTRIAKFIDASEIGLIVLG